MKFIFWGQFFTHIGLDVMGIDLFPDFVGYFLIFLGLGDLLQYSEHFQKAKPLAMIAVVSSFLGMILGIMGFLTEPFYGGVYILVELGFLVALDYHILSGVGALEKICQQDLPVGTLFTLWYVMLSIRGFISLSLLLMGDIIMMLYSLGLVIVIVATIAFLIYFHKAWKLFETWETRKSL